MNATRIGFERGSENYGREKENTYSAASIGNGLSVKQSSPWFNKLLAIYYVVQGLLLIAVGVGGLVLVDQNQLLVVKQWLRVIRLDPDNRFLHWLLTSILPVTNEMLEAFSVDSFVYCVGTRRRSLVLEALGLLSLGGRGWFFHPVAAV